MSVGIAPAQNPNKQITPSLGGGRAPKTALIAGVLLLIILLALGILPRLKRQSELTATAHEQAVAMPLVNLAQPRLSDATSELVLPATTQAIQETIIAARTSGYVRRWYAGLGQHVKPGELIAEIDVPETEQELREAKQQTTEAEQTVTQARAELAQDQASLEQAEAALKQAQTNLALARVNLDRSKTLVASGVVSRQDTDDKQALFDARQADVEAAQANVRVRQAAVKAQLAAIDAKQSSVSARQANQQLITERQSFERIVAPYAGTITARNIEVGTLVTAGGGTATSSGLYRIARLDTIRVFINVPQTYVAVMQPNLAAEVLVKELPDHKFIGKIFGTSHAIDPASRTLMVEVRVPNPGWQLLPGMAVNVKFNLPSPQRTLLIPVSALAVNAEGTQVFVVRNDQTVHTQKVTVGRDLGKELEILTGLSESDAVVTNPTDALHEGGRVQVAKASAH
jgi:RND family efflux transporter MFP subunit